MSVFGGQGFARHVTVSRTVSNSVTVHLTGIGLMIGLMMGIVVGTRTCFVVMHAEVTVSTRVSVTVFGAHGLLWQCSCDCSWNLNLVSV